MVVPSRRQSLNLWTTRFEESSLFLYRMSEWLAICLQTLEGTMNSFRVMLMSCAILTIGLTSGSPAEAGDGFVGLYEDAAGTQPCASVPPLSGKTLYVLGKLDGLTGGG